MSVLARGGALLLLEDPKTLKTFKGGGLYGRYCGGFEPQNDLVLLLITSILKTRPLRRVKMHRQKKTKQRLCKKRLQNFELIVDFREFRAVEVYLKFPFAKIIGNSDCTQVSIQRC